MAISMPKDSKGTCSDCGSTNDYVFGPHGSEHECYDCGASPASITAAGDEADNAAEAQALAQTNPGVLAAPRDRAGDPSRVAPAAASTGTQPCRHCGQGEAADDSDHICDNCAGDIMDSIAEGHTYGQ